MEKTPKKNEQKESLQERINEMLLFQDNFENWTEKTDYILYSYLDNSNQLKDSFTNINKFNYYRSDYATLLLKKNKNTDFKDKESEALNIVENKYKELTIDEFSLWFINSFHEQQKEMKKIDSEYIPETTRQSFGAVDLDAENYIHFDKFRDKESSEPITTRESFGAIINHFYQQGIFPEKLYADSWLMGRDSLRESLGFKKVKEHEIDICNLDPGTLGQCIDGQGKLKQDVLISFFQDNTLPYKRTEAEISIEDFIEKFGLDNRKGKEIIIQNDTEFLQEKQRLENIFQEFRDYFNDNHQTVLFEKIKDKLLENPIWNENIKKVEFKNILLILERIYDTAQKKIKPRYSYGAIY
jgi:hypothetical protein